MSYKFRKKVFDYLGARLFPENPMLNNPMDTNGICILKDERFINSCLEVKGHTLLDTPRLVNLWEYCLRSNPDGCIIEVGSYKGGGGLHLSNSRPKSKLFMFDSFEGFLSIDTKLDSNFNKTQFLDTRIENVIQLFSKKERIVEIIPGFFPASARDISIPPVSFAHVDVDVYQATLETLNFLDNKMIDRSFIILDDSRRGCEGVDVAIEEFVNKSRNWLSLPLFPSQELLVHKSWFSEGSTKII